MFCMKNYFWGVGQVRGLGRCISHYQWSIFCSANIYYRCLELPCYGLFENLYKCNCLDISKNATAEVSNKEEPLEDDYTFHYAKTTGNKQIQDVFHENMNQLADLLNVRVVKLL